MLIDQNVFREEGDTWVEEAKLERHSDWVCILFSNDCNLFCLAQQSILFEKFLEKILKLIILTDCIGRTNAVFFKKFKYWAMQKIFLFKMFLFKKMFKILNCFFR